MLPVSPNTKLGIKYHRQREHGNMIDLGQFNDMLYRYFSSQLMNVTGAIVQPPPCIVLRAHRNSSST